ncbi:hypothetical protein OIN60_15965 [Paenibacillus sp. P96]|uniref:Uncharacterized protein n=1 Tax=Paenibacillus zeirhizosphaerae TaxID=2987519 RepID=A0ABT9FU34_9BACL|nr:hypothetical protein [Paenibacillus sp. P96]MDP4098254.1 hypothetical protein [Paenibacillus sp. P96]
MEAKLERYYVLKRQQKETEEELAALRGEITAYCREQGISELETGGYTLKIVQQNRKEYDDDKLYEALPDPDVWRMLSKADASKITSLIKLKVISEDTVRPALSLKPVQLLVIDKK